MPILFVSPRPRPRLERFDPLLAHDASYFAASARIASLDRTSVAPMTVRDRSQTKAEQLSKMLKRIGGRGCERWSARSAKHAGRVVCLDARAQVELRLIADLLTRE